MRFKSHKNIKVKQVHILKNYYHFVIRRYKFVTQTQNIINRTQNVINRYKFVSQTQNEGKCIVNYHICVKGQKSNTNQYNYYIILVNT